MITAQATGVNNSPVFGAFLRRSPFPAAEGGAPNGAAPARRGATAALRPRGRCDRLRRTNDGPLARRRALDATLTTHLVHEIAPEITGSRVRRVIASGPGVVALEFDGARLVIAVDRALPLVALSHRRSDESGSAEADHRLSRELTGARVTSLRAIAETAIIELGFERTNPAGVATARTATIDLGRHPGLTIGPSTTGDRGDAPLPPADGFVVTEWTDNAGRPHARLGLAGTERHPEREHTRFDTANEAALHAFDAVFADLGPSRRRDIVRKAIAKQLRRKRRAVTKVQKEIDDAARADEYRSKGQLILARKDSIKRGDTSASLLDYDGVTSVEVEIDPKLTPQDNAEAYFRRAKKAEKRALRAPERLESLQSEVEKLDRDAAEAESADGAELERLEEIYTRPVSARGKKNKQEERVHYRTYHISGGWDVLVGKTNRDNDVLTHKVARPGDLWFHARQVAGSHVVLRIPDGDRRPDRQAILEAAAIAAFHSKAGRSSKVSVSYTEKRHVRKPRGAKAGLAVISREKSVMVRPAIPESTG